MKKMMFIATVFMLIFSKCRHHQSIGIAAQPPMGWNSWDCFGSDITEDQVKANAEWMAENLREFGWQYIVVDLGWYLHPQRTVHTFKQPRPPQTIDAFGRLLPDLIKFPSATNGVGFKSLADDIHRKGLKFGIHIMRGIPWQAVEQNLPILGTDFKARDIIAPTDTCVWYDGLIGIDMNHPGGQAYYHSIVQLYAEWGVDYIKADDMCQPYHAAEIAGLHQAIAACGRPIVLSLSPGAAPIEQLPHLRQNANLWRISPDFWDDWTFLYRQFELCHLWEGTALTGAWPDADMLPIGKLRKTGPDDYIAIHMGKTPEEITDEYSRLNDSEKKTLMTLWCIFRSPLMLGGHLPETDETTISLITNDRVLEVNQASHNNRQIYRNGSAIAWAADMSNSKDKVVALFNVDDVRSLTVSIGWDALGISGDHIVRDLWSGEEMGTFSSLFSVELAPHSSGLYRIRI